MTIAQLIAALEKIKQERGDLPVYIYYDGMHDPLEEYDVTVEKGWKHEPPMIVVIDS